MSQASDQILMRALWSQHAANKALEGAIAEFSAAAMYGDDKRKDAARVRCRVALDECLDATAAVIEAAQPLGPAALGTMPSVGSA